MATIFPASDTNATSNVNNDRFNAEAASWDSNVFVHDATNQAYKALKSKLACLNDTAKATRVLEIGCGTGLLSLQVAKDVHDLVAVDAAQGMIDVLQHKLKAADTPKNVHAVCVLLEDPEDKHLPPAANMDITNKDVDDSQPRVKFDLILSHLVLHHIPEVEPVLRTMIGCLRPGGQVALTDFQDFGPEAKKFHPQSKMNGVERHGIDKEWMRRLMVAAGFVDVNVEVGWTMQKEVEKFEGEFGEKASGAVGEGEMMDFPFLICMGSRPA